MVTGKHRGAFCNVTSGTGSEGTETAGTVIAACGYTELQENLVNELGDSFSFSYDLSIPYGKIFEF